MLLALALPDDWTWPKIWAVAETPVRLVGLIVFALLARWLVHRTIDRLAAQAAGFAPPKLKNPIKGPNAPKFLRTRAAVRSPYNERRGQRANALASLFKSITTAVVGTIVVLMTLDALGFSLGPLLASAGIAGAAIAFGAQNLVKDFLSGVFMLVEDQYGVGDVINMGSVVGTVEGVGLRVTRVRDGEGVLWHIRNGEVIQVGNKSQGWSALTLDVEVAYDEDVDRVEDLLNEVSAAMAKEEDWRDKFIDPPSSLGIQQVTSTAVTIRMLGKCVANQQFGVERELRQRIKTVFDQEEVKVPPPTWNGGQGTPTGAP
ncbi:mechanosensitive ion channel family protein [Flindersiella endophytica]